MVKADVRRDYYADLGLAPSAESEDIKKQFRKLALKFHPDRNPGREQEFIAKFQAIQAAHEILSDPQLRLKYDTDRLRAGYGKVYGPSKTSNQRRSQTTQAPTAAAPQPRPQRTPNSRPSAFNSGWGTPGTAPNETSAGAQRYSAHARADPQPWGRGQADTQTRADAYKGFSGMRGSTAGASWRGFDPQTGRTAAGSTAGGVPRPQNMPFGSGNGTQRPKSAYEYFKDNAKSQNNTPSPNSARKKQGFAPGTTSGGDEPPARNTSAYTHHRSERPSSMYFDSVPAPTAKKQPPPAPEPPKFTEDFERNRRGYASTGGEKTFFSSTPLGRPANTQQSSGSSRNPYSRTSSGYPKSEEIHDSASPKARRRDNYSPSPSTSSSGESHESDDEWHEVPHRRNGKPKAVPKSRLRPNQKFSDFHRQADSDNGSGEDPLTRPGVNHYEEAPRRPIKNTRKPRRVPGFGDLTADSEDTKGHNSDSAAFTQGSTRPQQNSGSPDSNARTTDSPKDTPRFKYEVFGHRSTSDVNNLHKKFSAEDWRDHMEGFDFLGASASKLNGARSSPNSRPRSRANPQEDSAESVPATRAAESNGFTSGSQEELQQTPTPFARAKFSADQWSEQLRDLSWNIPDGEKQRAAAHTPPRSPRKQSKAGTKLRSTPKGATVTTEAEESTETTNGNFAPGESVPNVGEFGEEAWAGPDIEAMDIDIDSPHVPKKTSVGAMQSSGYPDLSHVAQEVPAASTKSQPPKAAAGKSNAEARTPLFDLENLRNTAPFTSTNNGGIENLDDVHATLPFESRATEQTTTKRDIRPRELKLPNPPKRPSVPQTVTFAPGTQVLSIDKWKHYVSAMGTYMHDWNVFNSRMLLYFRARQEAVETGLSSNWISAVGDSARLKINDDDDADDNNMSHTHDSFEDFEETLIPGSGKGGFNAYLRGIEEDIQVRKHWEVACELHRECILDLGRLREWIHNGGRLVSFTTI